jgi:hypothetical protein
MLLVRSVHPDTSAAGLGIRPHAALLYPAGAVLPSPAQLATYWCLPGALDRALISYCGTNLTQSENPPRNNPHNTTRCMTVSWPIVGRPPVPISVVRTFTSGPIILPTPFDCPLPSGIARKAVAGDSSQFPLSAEAVRRLRDDRVRVRVLSAILFYAPTAAMVFAAVESLRWHGFQG